MTYVPEYSTVLAPIPADYDPNDYAPSDYNTVTTYQAVTVFNAGYDTVVPIPQPYPLITLGVYPFIQI